MSFSDGLHVFGCAVDGVGTNGILLEPFPFLPPFFFTNAKNSTCLSVSFIIWAYGCAVDSAGAAEVVRVCINTWVKWRKYLFNAFVYSPSCP